MINYAISTFNVIFQCQGGEVQEEKHGEREWRRKAFPCFNLLLITRSSRVWSAWKEGARPEDCT